jgi:pimeloyl-ACP methyl ester carboxylesterase
MKSIKFRGKNLFYNDEGTGSPFVFIHGFCEDNTLWNSFLNLLPSAIRVIRPDLPGFGKSDLPDGEITIDTYAEAIYEILKQEYISKCAVIGHSMGGYAALAFAERYADMLNGIALFHSSAFPDDDDKKQDRLRAIEFINTHSVDIYIDEVYSKLFAPEYYKTNTAAILQLQRYAYQFSAKGIINALNAMRNRPDRIAVLKEIKVPVLFIVGKKDMAVPYEKSRLQFAMPNILQLECVKAVGQFMALIQ